MRGVRIIARKATFVCQIVRYNSPKVFRTLLSCGEAWSSLWRKLRVAEVQECSCVMTGREEQAYEMAEVTSNVSIEPRLRWRIQPCTRWGCVHQPSSNWWRSGIGKSTLLLQVSTQLSQVRDSPLCQWEVCSSRSNSVQKRLGYCVSFISICRERELR